MAEAARDTAIRPWLASMRAEVARSSPELLALFDIYAAEAGFGRRFIAEDLARLPGAARLLEVGAGAMLLSCQLVREGWNVTALEPTGSGFGHFDRLRAIVLRQAAAQGCMPRVLATTAEGLSLRDEFDFAFSINVMEHVDEVERSVQRIGVSLKPGGTYRFTCPNYLFPYEPHFNIPTLFSKQLTGRVMARRIHSRPGIPDPAGLWRSLNWISVGQLRRIGRRTEELEISFDTRLIVAAFERIGTDAEFARRRSPLVRALAGGFVRLRLHKALAWVPAALQPLIDCRVQRRARSRP